MTVAGRVVAKEVTGGSGAAGARDSGAGVVDGDCGCRSDPRLLRDAKEPLIFSNRRTMDLTLAC
jgi:hypothetical protein